MKSKWIIKLAAVALSAIFISLLSVSRLRNVPYERDEISWYFHTKFFDEAFIKKKSYSFLWTGYESFDHPPVSKYIYGAYLYFRNQDYAKQREALEKKYGRWNMYFTIKSDPEITVTEFAPILFELRKVNIVFSLFILIEVVILFFMLSGSVFFSLFLAFVLSLNTVFTGSVAVITSDNHFLFFGLLAIILYFRSMKSKQWVWIAGVAVVSALSVGSKLTGVFLFVSVILNEVIRLIYANVSIMKTIKRIAVYVLLSLSVWILINPALHRFPVQNTWRYFSFRDFQSANIAYYIPEVALSTISDKVTAFVCTLLVRQCETHGAQGSLTPIGVLNILLLGLGFVYSFQSIRKKKSEIVFLILLGYITFMGYMAYLSNYSQRYFVLPQIILFTFQIFGAWSFAMYLKRKFFFFGQRR